MRQIKCLDLRKLGGTQIGGYAIFKIILYHIKYEIFQCKNSKRQSIMFEEVSNL